MRSMVELRADSTRIGVRAASSSRRTARMTARPSSSGSIRSRTTSAGSMGSMASSAAGPSAAVTTVNPSRSRYVRTSRTIFASSSTTRIGAVGRRLRSGVGIGSMVGARC